MRIIFMGTPEFAVPYLDALLAAGHTLALVVTQPDRPKGRGQALTPPPVKVRAEALQIPITQPEKLRTPEFHALIEAQKADLLVVVAFRILPDTLFALTKYGAVNVHGSLLPRYRGAAPIQWAIAQGETETGVTVFQLDAEVDHGLVWGISTTPIGPEETAGELFERLSHLGVDLLIQTLSDYEKGQITPQPQNHTLASPAPKLHKEDGALDLKQSAEYLHRRIRAFNPYPVCYARLEPLGKPLRIFKAQVLDAATQAALEAFDPTKPWRQPGDLRVGPDRYPVLKVGQGALRLEEVQLEGRPKMQGCDFVNGLRGLDGMRLQS